MSQDKKGSAKKLFDQGETIAAIARQMSVSRRTVERWAESELWREKRDVIPISEGKKPKPQPSLQNPPASTHNNPPAIRRRRGEGKPEIEIVEDAIDSLSALLGCSGMSDDDRPIDTRGIGGIAGALVKLLEYRRKIQPPTAVELAEQAIALGMTPEQFMLALQAAWRLRA